MNKKTHFNIRIVLFILTLCSLTVNFNTYCNPVLVKYSLDYRFDFAESKLFCKAEMYFDSVHSGDTVSLLLYRLLRVNSVKDIRGKDIKFTQAVNTYSDVGIFQVNYITVPVKGDAGRYEKLTIDYEGYLLGYAETGMAYIKDKIDPGFTILRMDCLAYPVPGTLSWTANREAGLSYFDYSVTVTIPDTLNVINGGELISRDAKNGYAVYVYKNIKPAWRIDIAIAKYSTIKEKDFSVHYFPADSAGAMILSGSILKVYPLYEQWFGSVPFSGYSIIEIPDGWGSQTDVSCILQTASAFKNEALLYEAYHEISHIWNIPSGDKNPCRLESEGLAMFLQYLTMERLNNKAGALDSAAEKIFQKLKKRFESDPEASNTPIIDYGKKRLTNLSYTKGMLFYYILYNELGEDKFMNTIKEFYAFYRDKQQKTEDFIAFLNGSANSFKVKALADDWILTAVSSQKILKAGSVKELFY